MQNEKDVEFVTIDLSKKQVDMAHPFHNDKNGKDYLRVYAPGGGTFFYPANSIKVREDNSKRVYFTRPEGTELQISERKKNVPDDRPNSEKYITRTVKIEDLKQMYEEERKEYIENTFVSMSVPTVWGKHFSSNGKDYVSISIPVPTNEHPDGEYYSFIVPEDRFRESEQEKGMSSFGFPKNKKGEEDTEYTVSLKSSHKQLDGTYQNVYMDVTSTMLQKYVEEACNHSNSKDAFVNVEITQKLVRQFESNTGKKLAAVLVPVFDDKQKKDVFYEIVVPAERIRTSSDDKVQLSLFKNGPDGNAYSFNAKHSFRTENNQFREVTLKMTSEEVIRHFNDSSQRYRENHKENKETRTLADELGGDGEHEQNIENVMQYRHKGR